MKIFADENVEAVIVTWLRTEGHDVVWAAELHEGDPDPTILRWADEEQRVLLTSDLDFGEHVFRNRLATRGLILMRIQARTDVERLDVLRENWASVSAGVYGHFIVLTRDRIRRRPLP